MTKQRPEARSATYDICIWGPVPRELRERLPSADLLTTSAQTAFVRDVDSLTEVDALLEQMQSMGLVLAELHREPDLSSDTGGRHGKGVAHAHAL